MKRKENGGASKNEKKKKAKNENQEKWGGIWFIKSVAEKSKLE